MRHLRIPRSLLAYLLAAIAALSVTLSVAQAWMAHAVFDEERFATIAVQVSHRQDIQQELRRVLVKQIIQAQPDLVSVRPLLETVVDAVLESGIARSVIIRGARELHEILFQGDRPDLVLAIPDVMTLIAAGVRAYDPDVADRIPGGSTVGTVPITERNAATRILEINSQLALLRWIFVGMAVAAFAGALLVAPTRPPVVAAAGLGLVAGAILTWLAVGIIEDIIQDSIDGNPVAADAAAAVWRLYADGLIWWMWIVAMCGTVMATIASSAQAAIPARERIEAINAWFIFAWSVWWTRVVLASALMLLGTFLLFSPLVTIRVATQAAGLALLYLGGVEVFRALGFTRVRRPRVASPAGTSSPPIAGRLVQGFAAACLAGGLITIGTVFWINRGSLTVEQASEPPPIEHCNGSANLCDRPLDKIAWAATHNSMSASDESGWFLANQTRGIAQQLEDGIRVLLIDLYYGYATNNGVRTDPDVGNVADRFEGGLGPEATIALANLVNLIGPIPEGGEPSLYLCHGYCELGATPFQRTLGELSSFLDKNPHEVVGLVLQDYVDPFDVEAALTRAGLIDLVYTLSPGEPLPTLREMIELDRRIFVLAENVGSQPAPAWYHDVLNWVQETPYVFRTPGDLSCRPNRGDASAPFFLLNHWITSDLPAPRDGAVLNTREFIVARVHECEEVRARPVNFIAVNFYEVGDLVGAVDELNSEE
ncbi:MAG: hypothetical protein KC482_03240 [Dehalococcoidia bacterium]|nr:hypothetical protein [Dehalococcoidia bacterium]MCA9852601.1 hypothetical protein [Dehalococcoidia bacterium]